MDLFDEIGVSTEDITETNKKLYTEAKEVGMSVNEPEKEKKQHKIFYGLSPEDRHIAVQMHIVPKAYEQSAFDTNKIRENLIRENIRNKRKYNICNFSDYEQVCNGVLSSIRMKMLPSRSYLIGAPNGFGKTSFVYECLITLNSFGFRVVPFISLTELAQIKRDNDSEILKPKSNVAYKYIIKDNNKLYERLQDEDGNEIIGDEYVKRPAKIENLFTYSDYINSDCLFTFFTEETSRETESKMLNHILQIRGAKGLPTIVMMSNSLELYTRSIELRKYIWDEILAYSEEDNCYDKIYHVSCYKKPRQGKLAEKGENIESDTGIVH